MAITEALNQLDQTKAIKEGIMAEAVTKMENLNVVEDMMAVHRGQMNKGAAFDKQVELMKQHYA